VSAEVLAGETATFTAAASGVPDPAVQWQVSADGGVTFVDIPGATSKTYSFAASLEDDQKQYRAVFTNVAGSDTRDASTLTVVEPPTFTSGSQAFVEVGVPATFTIEASGQPAPTSSLTSGTLPEGVTFEPATGTLAGTPATGTSGVHDLE